MCTMSTSSSLVCFFISQLFVFQLVHCHCPKEFQCGTATLSFPFSKRSEPNCGLLLVDCGSYPTIQIQPGGNWTIYNPSNNTIWIIPPFYKKKSCSVFNNITLPENNSAISWSTHLPKVSLLKCNTSSINQSSHEVSGFKNFSECKNESQFDIYYNYSNGLILDPAGNDYPSGCSIIQWPIGNRTFDPRVEQQLFHLLDVGFPFNWILNGSCRECYLGGHRCRVDHQNYTCYNDTEEVRKLGLILGPVLGGVAFLLFVILIIWRRKRRINRDPYLISSDPSTSKADVESASSYFGASVYSYAELEKATDTFASSRQLGEGGFGIVYHGKLQDGREVAVKRLYEHNFNRMEHFMNEIRILKTLRHPNLVSLYGCTSRLSRELLLVYEYVPNGSLADHIHGEKANTLSLTWAIRMNIALQTANALAYLHKSDIIHRDVKTNNILLDQTFNVKVADFGLSRLFPNDVTHVSTAPQGTPGYVDPEYHECYQLTDKSDVYSFGVVLVELISSLPAVDVKRKRREINLANLAMRKIQTKAIHELIDPTLEYESNPEVRLKMNSVAELAFCCLQLEKEMRPGMDEVVEALETIKNMNFGIKNGDVDDEFVFEKALETHHSPESDEAVLIKNMKLDRSPVSVDEPWISESSTSSWSLETF